MQLILISIVLGFNPLALLLILFSFPVSILVIFGSATFITVSPIFLIVQLQVKLSSKERRITGLKEEVTTLKLRLNEEEQRVASLRSQRVAIEEELETVMEVITHLSPHSERSVGA